MSHSPKSTFGIHARRLSRRTMLRGAGVAIALPTLECMVPRSFAQSSQAVPRRLVAIHFELSFHPPNMMPEKAGRDYELTPYLQPLDDMRNDFTVISGTSHPEVDGGHAATMSWLTGAPHPGAANFRNSVSIDQLAAQQIGLQTLFASRQMGSSIAISPNGVKLPGSPYPGFTTSTRCLSKVGRIRKPNGWIDCAKDKACSIPCWKLRAACNCASASRTS
jgi:hypothetical protein